MTYQTGKTVGSCLVVDKLLNELGISTALGKSNMADLVKWLIFGAPGKVCVGGIKCT